MKIGILEDDSALFNLYELCFSNLGYGVSGSSTISDFKGVISNEQFDLLLIDWTLPDGHADVVIKWVRENFDWEIPIIVVSATEDEGNVVNALWLGADDYVFKPVRINELIARVQALLRRKSGNPHGRIISFPPYEVNLRESRISLYGEAISLTQTEFDLAYFFFENADKLIPRIKVLHKVWGRFADIEIRTIDAHISRLKKKLRIGPENGWRISAVYGYGYRLEKCSQPDEQ